MSDNVTDIVDQLNETVVCYLACMEDRDMHCSRILEGAREITALRKQLEQAREALVKCQWELETIDRTQSTNFRRVQELILANREALKGKS